MAILKFEVNTDDIFENYDEEFGPSGSSFEALFKDAMMKELKKAAVDEVLKLPIKELIEKIIAGVDAAVESKLTGLINEDIAITDRWGKPEFIGSVEDYIKKQIDEKMLKPVGSDGKPLSGCTNSDAPKWIDWAIKKEIETQLKEIKTDASNTAQRFCKNTLKEALEEFKTKTLKAEIVKHLEAVGVVGK